MLIVFSGRPGSGKSTLARHLAAAIGATWLRIDSIEQALLRMPHRAPTPIGAAGYVAAYAVAQDNLRLGRTVVADSVNPLAATREAWHAVARDAGVTALDVEVRCDDAGEHRRRIETRMPEIEGHRLPTWDEVLAQTWEPWQADVLRVDTAGRSVDDCVAEPRVRLRR